MADSDYERKPAWQLEAQSWERSEALLSAMQCWLQSFTMYSTMDFEQLKERMRGTWMAGDFGQIAQYSAQGAEEFVNRPSILPGMRVLDVACGTGNLAIPAARKGAQVTGVDIAPNLLEQARRRAEAEGLKISFEEGDAERLAYPDASFDIVMSDSAPCLLHARSLSPES